MFRRRPVSFGTQQSSSSYFEEDRVKGPPRDMLKGRTVALVVSARPSFHNLSAVLPPFIARRYGCRTCEIVSYSTLYKNPESINADILVLSPLLPDNFRRHSDEIKKSLSVIRELKQGAVIILGICEEQKPEVRKWPVGLVDVVEDGSQDDLTLLKRGILRLKGLQ